MSLRGGRQSRLGVVVQQWTPSLDSWDGSSPLSLSFYKGEKHFYKGSFYKELGFRVAAQLRPLDCLMSCCPVPGDTGGPSAYLWLQPLPLHQELCAALGYRRQPFYQSVADLRSNSKAIAPEGQGQRQPCVIVPSGIRDRA